MYNSIISIIMMSELAEKLFTKSIIHMLLSTSSQLNNKTILIKKKEAISLHTS